MQALERLFELTEPMVFYTVYNLDGQNVGSISGLFLAFVTRQASETW